MSAVLSVILIVFLCSLKVLKLPRVRLGDDGVSALAQALITNCTVTDLDLSTNGIGTKGAESLAKMLSHYSCMISTLDLSLNFLSEAGVNALGTPIRQPPTFLVALHFP